MASLFGRVKCFLSSFLVLYTIYLVTYKCSKLQETPLEHGIETIFHPLSHTHNKLCDSLNGGVEYLRPYGESAKAFLDEHVCSHQLFKEYDIANKIEIVKVNYFEYVYPLVIKLFEYIEIVEYHVSERLVEVYEKLKAVYAENVAKKLA